MAPTAGRLAACSPAATGVQAPRPRPTPTYFQVPSGETDLDASIVLANNPSAGQVPGDVLVASLVDPNGQTVGYSSNFTLEPTSSGLEAVASTFTQLYHVAPIPGQWEVVLGWSNPVVGDELEDPFSGSVAFNQVSVSSNLPDSPSASVPALTSTAFDVHVKNTGVAPEGFFVDPRLNNQTETVNLPNQNPAVTATAFTIPLPAAFPSPSTRSPRTRPSSRPTSPAPIGARRLPSTCRTLLVTLTSARP